MGFSLFEDAAIVNFSLIAALIGFAVFCVSYALHVWYRRNRAAHGEGKTPGKVQRIERWSLRLAIAGAIAVALTVALREVVKPTGTLVPDGVFAVRAPDDLFVEFVHAEGPVAKGDILAQFQAPAAAAEIEELKLQRAEAEAKQRELRLAPLKLDPELTRLHQNAILQANQARASRDQILPAHEFVRRFGVSDRVVTLEELRRLRVDLDTARGELNEALAREQFVVRELQRIQALQRHKVATASELDSQRAERKMLSAKIARLNRRIVNIEAQQAQVKQDGLALQATTRQQLKDYGAELQRADRERREALELSSNLARRLAEDAQRATQQRDAELASAATKIQQLDVQLVGLEDTLVVRAPFDGTVYFRDRSPKSADAGQPVVVLGTQQSFRLRLRLRNAQVAALENAQTITVEFSKPALESYFPARFHGSTRLPRRPGYSLVEMECRPPPESARDIVRGGSIQARLLWRPPLTTMWPFQLGLIMLACGGLGQGTAIWMRRRSVRAGSSSLRPPREETAPSADWQLDRQLLPLDYKVPQRAVAEHAELGAVGAVLDSLGGQLRHAVLKGKVDTALLGAVEWALDRHHVRAVRAFAAALGDEQDAERLTARIAGFVEQHSALVRRNGHADAKAMRACCERLLQVLRIVKPQMMPESHTAEMGLSI